MSQSPVPPRYPPQYPQQPQVPPQYPPQPGAPVPPYPQPEQEGYLVNAPGQPPAYPQGAQPLNYLTPGAPAGGIWTYGNILVMHRQAQLPPNCIKCGAPGEGQPMKRKLTWHPWWAYLIILANLIIYIIVAAIISSRATVYVGVCARHRAKRRTHLMIAWLLFIGSIVAFIAAGSVGGGRGRGNDDLIAGLIIGGVVALLASLIWAVVISTMICSPHKIDPQYVWLKGAGPEYLAQFPPMPGGPQGY